MIKEALAALGHSARDLFRNWRGLLLLALVYAALLACVYFFLAVGVATSWQLVYGTVLTGLAAPLLWLLLEAGAANAALSGRGRSHGRAPRAARLVEGAAAGAPAYRARGALRLPAQQAARLAAEGRGGFAGLHGGGRGAGPRPAPLHWQEALVSSLWLLLLGFVLPLVAAHLWLAAAREGLKATLKNLHRVVGRAFAARSVFVYAVGLFVFGLMPYFVVFTRTSVSNGWAELLRLRAAARARLRSHAGGLGHHARRARARDAPARRKPRRGRAGRRRRPRRRPRPSSRNCKPERKSDK